MSLVQAENKSVRLTSLSHGGGCGCKIAPGILSNLLKSQLPLSFPKELLVGTETSDDAAVYQINENQALIATTDFFMPIVDNPRHFGQIAATNAISDIYAMGGKPLMALALVGMPINVLPHEDIAAILDGGREICAKAGIPVAGGHSIDSVEPIYGLAVIGIVDPKLLKKNSTAHAGDVLVLGKSLGVGVHALTDVTGFGLLGHALEICKGSDLQGQIRYSDLNILPGVIDLAADGCITGASNRNWISYGDQVSIHDSLGELEKALLTDPQTSGGLLVACDPSAVDEVLRIFREEGFDFVTEIGSLVQRNHSPHYLTVLA
jgi:selenide,water dikinase